MVIKNRKVIRLLAAFIFLVSLSVLAGWAFGIIAFTSITLNMATMNPVTAITLLFLSTWLFIHCLRKRRKIYVAMELAIAAWVFSIGLLKLLEYAGVLNMHIDKMLFAQKLSEQVVRSTMAPATAFLFLLSGLAVFNSYAAGKVMAMTIINDVIVVAGFLLSYIGVIGYIYSLDPFYRIGPFVQMALNTAACFTVLFIAFFFMFRHGRLSSVLFSKNIGGKLARRAIPAILLIPPAFGYSRLLLQRAHFYNVNYAVALDTALLVLAALLLIFYYAYILNKNDTERKEAEKVVIQSEEKYRLLIHALKEGVIYFNKKGEILFSNPSFSAMTGYSPDELTGKNIITTLIPQEDWPKSEQRMAERRNGIAADIEAVILHKDGTRILVSVSSQPIIKNGQVISFLSMFIDITERRKREEDIEAFSASAAHDLNAPLTRVESMAGLIMEFSKDHLSADDMECLEVILKTAVDMRQLLKDLLLFSKVGAEKMNKVPIDMNEMVSQVVASAPPSPVAIHIDKLPVAYGDPAALKQVWANLVFNAIKYSSKKDKPEIHISFATVNEKNVYSVKDNGAGFDMKESWMLFAPFKRLHTEFEGNGLGLPIVKRIVEKHGGKIWADAEVEKGATFYFTI